MWVSWLWRGRRADDGCGFNWIAKRRRNTGLDGAQCRDERSIAAQAAYRYARNGPWRENASMLALRTRDEKHGSGIGPSSRRCNSLIAAR
jgi:hypothetical protein